MNHRVFLLVFLFIFSLVLLCALGWPHPGPSPSRAAAKLRTRLHRLLKPRCPDDCPACRLASTASSAAEPVHADVASLARGQATGFHRALRRRGVPVEFVVYPREPHGIAERAHQIDILKRVRRWYDRWLKG